MEFLNFPIVALGAALDLPDRRDASMRSRSAAACVRATSSWWWRARRPTPCSSCRQAGVLFLDREHKLMGEASAAAPELLGHTCGAGTAFVQVIAELVRRERAPRSRRLSRIAVEGRAQPRWSTPRRIRWQRVHSGSRHLAIRFSRLVVDGRVHHIIVSIERISAPRLVPHTIEVPVLERGNFRQAAGGRNRHAARRSSSTRRRIRRRREPARSSAGTAAEPVAAPPVTERCRGPRFPRPRSPPPPMIDAANSSSGRSTSPRDSPSLTRRRGARPGARPLDHRDS